MMIVFNLTPGCPCLLMIYMLIKLIPMLLSKIITFNYFFEKKIYFTQRNKSTKNYIIYTLQNRYILPTIKRQHIIYMQEASGQPHIDLYRSKLYSLYTYIL